MYTCICNLDVIQLETLIAAQMLRKQNQILLCKLHSLVSPYGGIRSYAPNHSNCEKNAVSGITWCEEHGTLLTKADTV